VQCMKDEERYNLWSQFLKVYKEYFVTDEEIWFKKFEELKTFIGDNQRTPLSSPKNPVELQLGRWLSSQQKNYKNKTDRMKVESRYNLWTRFIEDYKEYFVTRDEIWVQKFEKLKLFMDTNKQKPSSTSKKNDEKQLSEWLSGQQKNYKTKTDGMKDETRYNLWTQFLEDYKEYFVSDEEIWHQRLEELKAFIDDNKRRPLPSSKYSDEKQIGSWLSAQQSTYKKKTKGMKDTTRYNILSKFLEDYKEYFVSHVELWFQMFERCKTFMCANKRRPSPFSKNIEEKQLGSWLHHQIHNYKNNTAAMKDITRYNIWTQFLEEYKVYFNDNPTITPKKKKSTNLSSQNLSFFECSK